MRGVALGQRPCEIPLQQKGQLREARAFQQAIHDVCADSPGVEISRCLGRQTQLGDLIILPVRDRRFAQKEIRGNPEAPRDSKQILAVQPVRRVGEKPAQRAFRDVDEGTLATHDAVGWDVPNDTFELTVTEVRLELIRSRASGGERTGLLTPAWVFYGTIGGTAAVGDVGFFPAIVLAVNAVDGTVLDVDKGY